MVRLLVLLLLLLTSCATRTQFTGNGPKTKYKPISKRESIIKCYKLLVLYKAKPELASKFCKEIHEDK